MEFNPTRSGFVMVPSKEHLDGTLLYTGQRQQQTTAPEQPADPVSNPSHYTQGRSIEPIDAIEDWQLPYHLGNVVKYISRAGRKGSTLEDLKKAAWYLDRYIKQLSGGAK
jgi:hypothetical protein